MFHVAALYRFTPFADPAALCPPLEAVCRAKGVRGSLLLAREGINGTIAGPRAGLDHVLSHIRALPGCAGIDWKESTAARMPFGRMKVRLKREIVSMGRGMEEMGAPGTYVPPAEWNGLIAAPDVAVIDTRNAYEVAIGSFAGAEDPGTASFRDFPAWWRANRDRFASKRIAMFCTGGIRCEKSTAFLRSEGVEEVYHLDGGILKYLEEVPEADSLWRGECFVFDQRVAVTHGLAEGRAELCHACRRPLMPEDRARPEFEDGVCCHRCATEYDAAQRARFRERHRQVKLAEARGGEHLGAVTGGRPGSAG
jgi:UPF0176 protein